jgi:formylglycine-generating enzyme required for sulfatase activity
MIVASFPTMKLRFPKTIEAWRKRDESNPIWKSIVEGFRPIPAGDCYYGADSSEDTVKPIHVEAFQMHQYPVTNVMYELFDPGHRKNRWSESRRHPLDNDDHCPVVNVTWFDAKCFALWCGSDTRTVVVPTELQWEHSCRAGKKFRYSYGDDGDELKHHAWYGEDLQTYSTHPVGLKKPNGNQLYDMHGNVSEWREDWNDNNSERKTVRGGSSYFFAESCHVSYRFWCGPDFRFCSLGFRLICMDFG